VSHAYALLTKAGRLRLARLIVDQDWPLRRAAERWSCSITTTPPVGLPFRAEGPAGVRGRSPRPVHRPRQTLLGPGEDRGTEGPPPVGTGPGSPATWG
jgi:hypothetical protein